MIKKDTRVHLVGISHKGDELRTQHLMREAPEPAKPAVRKVAQYKSRVLPGQAPAVTYQCKGIYSFGDGDPQAKAALRPGADDHLQFHSLADKGSSIYKRHHP